MSKLVEIRLNDAIDSITLVSGALNRAMQRRYDAEQLRGKIKKIGAPGGIMDQIEMILSQCKRMLTYPPRDRSLPPDEDIKKASNAWIDLQAEWLGILRLASRLRTYRFDPGAWKPHVDKSKDLLKLKTDSLRDIQQDVRHQAPAELLRALAKQRPFWGEHLETVAGIVLRDEGYDRGLSMFADAIVKLCAGLSVSGNEDRPDTFTLNVLGRDESILKDLNHTVYFRFPAWSVWGLPLIGHDVWHASKLGGPLFKQRVLKSAKKFGMTDEQTESIWMEPLIQDCLADTFATFVLGPAYAFACILLLLNVESARDQVRAEIVLRTLKRIRPFYKDEDSNKHSQKRSDEDSPEHADEDSDNNPERDPVVFLIREAWKKARKTISGTSAAVECLLERDCHAVDNLLNAYWESIRERAQRTIDETPRVSGLPAACIQAEAKGVCKLAMVRCDLSGPSGACPMANERLIRDLSDSLIQFLPPTLRYDENKWQAASEDLSQYLRADNWTRIKPPHSVDELDLRYILNAAWFERLNTEESEANEISMIATRAAHLCRRAIRLRSRSNLSGDRHGSYLPQAGRDR